MSEENPKNFFEANNIDIRFNGSANLEKLLEDTKEVISRLQTLPVNLVTGLINPHYGPKFDVLHRPLLAIYANGTLYIHVRQDEPYTHINIPPEAQHVTVDICTRNVKFIHRDKHYAIEIPQLPPTQKP
ncbi:MAG: hypothetical protein Q7R56_00625 [Nanoarchaeota archaeon]|nr:hypothetical protein [Nanoarchaeota archaeon]